MGAGEAFLGGTGLGLSIRVTGHPGSSLPEGAAMLEAMNRSDDATPLAIPADSANTMRRLQDCCTSDWWTSLSDHPEAEMLLAVLERLRTRRAATTFVTVIFHRGHAGNEAAHELAKAGAPEEGALHYKRAADKPTVLLCSPAGEIEDGNRMDKRHSWEEIQQRALRQRKLILAKGASRTRVRINNPAVMDAHMGKSL